MKGVESENPGTSGVALAGSNQSSGRLAYVIPKEGGALWIDNLAIPKGASNLGAAYAFLDFVMELEIAAKIVNHVHYACANRAALPLIDAKVQADPSIYPPQEILNRCELIEDLGETTQLLDQLWTEVKAQ
jgi:spermidine/putrescine transport system substrate-binding protein